MYCIANGVVDDYHIPLPWHRFALKLYLKHIHFVVIEKAIDTLEIGSGIQEAYDDEGLLTSYDSFEGTRWLGQTFTPQENFKLTKFELYLKRQSTISTIWVLFRNTDINGHPIPPNLASYEFPGNELLETFTWREIAITYPNLVAFTKYAIICVGPDLPTGHYPHWGLDSIGALYPRGCYERSTNSGSSWISDTNKDFGFRAYGEYETGEKKAGLLHVRHPALSTIVHKRGEATVNRYESLSSLDEEYLTGQVGIDVEAGDIIEATTITGIEKKYQVV
ncbi:unnamed protein product [marine sediment metagenome]|uniref:Uncharacterized protein n=1 Tax=marine sediment metagenome TaxID=412755 RepID=X1RWB9_9ZZZZ